MFHAPPKGLTRYFQINTIAPPAITPAIAPSFVVLFQKSAVSVSAPNAPPKPAHANDTIPNTELEGSLARNTATSATPISANLAARSVAFPLNFTLKTEPKISLDIADDYSFPSKS